MAKTVEKLRLRFRIRRMGIAFLDQTWGRFQRWNWSRKYQTSKDLECLWRLEREEEFAKTVDAAFASFPQSLTRGGPPRQELEKLFEAIREDRPQSLNPSRYYYLADPALIKVGNLKGHSMFECSDLALCRLKKQLKDKGWEFKLDKELPVARFHAVKDEAEVYAYTVDTCSDVCLDV